MKTAISIPDPVFKSAEQLASRLRVSRSALYSKALKAFLDEHRDGLVTSRLNEVYGASEDISVLDSDLASMQRRSISRDKW
jgi:metal-responsive CopG/Arc/MetJ family transcriptional regulator